MTLILGLNIKYLKQLSVSLFFINISLLFPMKSYAQETEERPIFKPTPNNFAGSVSPFITAAPKSLAAQKLNKSSYPAEAEIFCGTEQCIFGLTRGLAIGGDIVGMLSAPLRQYVDPNWVAGSLSVIDIFGGFQILRDENARNYMNAQLGYRRLSFDDNTNKIVTQGFTTSVNYSQLITPIYLQGLEFSAFFAIGNTSLNNTPALYLDSSGHAKLNNTAGYFYRISQSYPTFRVSLPADFELINWGANQTGLAKPIHGYLELNPFYVQNNLMFSYNNISLQKTEQNFGIRVAAVSSYESSAEETKSGRYALKGSLGLDVSTSNVTTTRTGSVDLDLPKRSLVAPYIELAGSWQF